MDVYNHKTIMLEAIREAQSDFDPSEANLAIIADEVSSASILYSRAYLAEYARLLGHDHMECMRLVQSLLPMPEPEDMCSDCKVRAVGNVVNAPVGPLCDECAWDRYGAGAEDYL